MSYLAVFGTGYGFCSEGGWQPCCIQSRRPTGL